MGAPYFKYKALIEHNKGFCLSSNYQLYGDISQRIMDSIKMLVPGDIEIYSIDEAFVYIDTKKVDSLINLFHMVRELIYKWIGIPVSIGIGPTKTLAKLANNHAKKMTQTGVFFFQNKILQKDIMINTAVDEIWGISRRWGSKLKSLGYTNAYQLCHADTSTIRLLFGVTLTRTIKELQGISCIEIEQAKDKKNIMSSKSFGTLVSDIKSIEEALSNYAARACEKLRAQNGKAQGISVFLHTNRFNIKEPQYSNVATIGFESSTSNTGYIIGQAKKLLRQIYRKGYKYKKTGIMLLDIIPKDYIQYNLFSSAYNNDNEELMNLIDKINKKFGRNTIFHLAQGVNRDWQMQSNNRSPRYTTCWEELLKI